MNFLKEFQELAVAVAKSSTIVEKDRSVDIIQKRFCLNGENLYTLDEIGAFYGITRERIRQIEAKSISNLRIVLAGHSLKNGTSATDAMIIEFEKVKQNIYDQDFIIIESDAVNFLKKECSLTKESLELNAVPLLLEVLGYIKIPEAIKGYSGSINPCWYLGETYNIKSIEKVLADSTAKCITQPA